MPVVSFATGERLRNVGLAQRPARSAGIFPVRTKPQHVLCGEDHLCTLPARSAWP
jgi:hypothetical protein